MVPEKKKSAIASNYRKGFKKVETLESVNEEYISEEDADFMIANNIDGRNIE
jgi:hypothetical protein